MKGKKEKRVKEGCIKEEAKTERGMNDSNWKVGEGYAAVRRRRKRRWQRRMELEGWRRSAREVHDVDGCGSATGGDQQSTSSKPIALLLALDRHLSNVETSANLVPLVDVAVTSSALQHSADCSPAHCVYRSGAVPHHYIVQTTTFSTLAGADGKHRPGPFLLQLPVSPQVPTRAGGIRIDSSAEGWAALYLFGLLRIGYQFVSSNPYWTTRADSQMDSSGLSSRCNQSSNSSS